ncbi:MAG: hypothetical protein JWM53_6005, partial [bacterium]|nr:hypothetical protein [bacterium]
FGRYVTVKVHQGGDSSVIDTEVDLERLGRRLGVLQDFEELKESTTTNA